MVTYPGVRAVAEFLGLRTFGVAMDDAALAEIGGIEAAGDDPFEEGVFGEPGGFGIGGLDAAVIWDATAAQHGLGVVADPDLALRSAFDPVRQHAVDTATCSPSRIACAGRRHPR